jgi:hypothetical protein
MDKVDYDQRMLSLINESMFKKLNVNPLSRMKKGATEAIKSVTEVFGNRFQYSLIMSNANVPKMYGLPKVHKIGQKMRPIISNVNAPVLIENITK